MFNIHLNSSVLHCSIYSLKVHGQELRPHCTVALLTGINLRQANTIQIALLNKKNLQLNGIKKQNSFGSGVQMQFKNIEHNEKDLLV